MTRADMCVRAIGNRSRRAAEIALHLGNGDGIDRDRNRVSVPARQRRIGTCSILPNGAYPRSRRETIARDADCGGTCSHRAGSDETSKRLGRRHGKWHKKGAGPKNQPDGAGRWRETGRPGREIVVIGLVRLALRRPYTSAIAALLILLMGALSVTRMIVDIFPVIDIPVVLVVWNYPGLTTEDMERRVVLHQRARLFDHGQRHRAHRIAVDPRHRHPQGLFPARHRHRRRHRADHRGQHTRSCASRRRACTPPGVIQFNASNVPVVQMTHVEQDADRAADLRLQPELHPGQAVHHPRPVHARRRSAASAPDQRRYRSGAAAGQGLLARRRGQRAAGLQRDRAGRHRAHRRTRIQRRAQFQPERGGPVQRAADRRLQRRAGDSRRRRAMSATASPTQTNIVHVNGKRAVYLAILKHADASTLAVVEATRAAAAGDPGGGAARAWS